MQVALLRHKVFYFGETNQAPSQMAQQEVYEYTCSGPCSITLRVSTLRRITLRLLFPDSLSSKLTIQVIINLVSLMGFLAFFATLCMGTLDTANTGNSRHSLFIRYHSDVKNASVKHFCFSHSVFSAWFSLWDAARPRFPRLPQHRVFAYVRLLVLNFACN